MSNALVIDISHHQTEPDFAAVKSGGTIGVILKATEGTSYVDPTFKKRQAAAKKVGLFVSTYHFLKSGNIEAQMDFYVKTVAPDDGDRLVIDYEDQKLKLADLETAIKRLQKIAPKCEITVYGANGFLGAQLGGKINSVLAMTSLWIASYTTASTPTNRDLKGTWPAWSLWQYSDKGTVDGIKGPVDVNRWNGDPAKLADWFHRDDTQPEPMPIPTPEPDVPVARPTVIVDVKAPDGVAIVFSLNGKPFA